MELVGIGQAFADRSNLARSLKIDLGTALHFVSSVSVVHEDVSSNSLGIYNVANAVKDGKVRFLQPNGTGYITKERPASCAWDPAGGITYKRSDVSLCAHNVQIEHCTEDVPGWEGIFGQGNDVQDLLSTEVGSKFFNDLVEGTYVAIGNDLMKSAHWGKHPIVASAEASYTGDSNMFARIKKTLSICGGYLTMVDQLKTAGKANYNVTIPGGNISNDTYTTTPVPLFQALVAAQTTELKALIAKRRAKGISPVIMVSGGIFEAYKKDLADNYTAIPDAYLYKISGDFAAQYGLVPYTIMDDCLKWDGYWIKRMHLWDEVAADLQITHHRALLTVPGNFGLGLDVMGPNDIALQFDQITVGKEAGKIYGQANYRMGTAIIDDRLCVNASYVSA